MGKGDGEMDVGREGMWGGGVFTHTGPVRYFSFCLTPCKLDMNVACEAIIVLFSACCSSVTTFSAQTISTDLNKMSSTQLRVEPWSQTWSRTSLTTC